jgi:hypothetical protein
MAEILSDILIVLGAAIVVAGIGFIYWPLAIIVAGVGVVVAGVLAGWKTSHTPQEGKQ